MWSDDEEMFRTEPIEATWEEYTQIYRSFEQFLTISEHDRKEVVRVFHIEQDVPVPEDSEIDFVPTNMLSAVFLNTHKGSTPCWVGFFWSPRETAVGVLFMRSRRQ